MRRRRVDQLKIAQTIMHYGKELKINDLKLLASGSIEIHLSDGTTMRRTPGAKVDLVK